MKSFLTILTVLTVLAFPVRAEQSAVKQIEPTGDQKEVMQAFDLTKQLSCQPLPNGQACAYVNNNETDLETPKVFLMVTNYDLSILKDKRPKTIEDALIVFKKINPASGALDTIIKNEKNFFSFNYSKGDSTDVVGFGWLTPEHNLSLVEAVNEDPNNTDTMHKTFEDIKLKLKNKE